MISDLSSCKRILIIKMSSIGDVVSATPVAKAIRTAMPDAYLAWLVESKSKDVVVGNPYLDEVIIWDRKDTGISAAKKIAGFVTSMRKLRSELHERKFDLAIDFQGLFRSALAIHASGASYRLGFDDAREGSVRFYNVIWPGCTSKIKGPRKYLEILQALNILTDDLDMHFPIGEDDRLFAEEFIADCISKYPALKGTAVLCPATTWPQKHWTENGWAYLADSLVSEYAMLPVFLGSKADVPLIERILNLMENKGINAAGRTTLKRAAALIDQSNLTFAVDTGLLHISLALNRPTVGIFGPTRWRQFPVKETFKVAAGNLPCMPCLRHPKCKEFDCMQALTLEDVLSAAEPMLELAHRVRCG